MNHHFIAALLGLGLIAYGCSGAQTVEATTCSPKADVWHQVELARVCAGKTTDECPEAEGLRAYYLELEAAECSDKP